LNPSSKNTEEILSSQPDEYLTALIRSSDVIAFKELFFRHHQHLIQFVNSRINDVHFAEDIVQEIFIRVWSRRNDLKPDKSIKSYLFQIASRLIVDHYRKQNNRNISTDEFPNILDSFQITDGYEYIEKKEVFQKFESAIQLLPQQCRIIFILSRFDGLKYAEIADLLNISIKTVENQIGKALQRLRENLIPLFNDNE